MVVPCVPELIYICTSAADTLGCLYRLACLQPAAAAGHDHA